MKSIHLLSFTLLAAWLTACSLAADITPPPGYKPPALAPTRPPAQPASPAAAPNPANGAAIYTEKCAPCHGATGLGDGSQAAMLQGQGVTVPALGSPELGRAAVPAEWYDIVTNGNMQKFMPPFASLSDSQRWDVVAYALSLGDSPEDLAAGQALFAANCARCHGDAGRGDGPDAADLPVRPANFTDQQFMAGLSANTVYETATSGKDPMPAFGDKLSEAERWQLAAYVRGLSFAGEIAAPAAMPTPGAESTPQVAAAPSITETGAISASVSGMITHAGGGSVPTELPVTLYAFEVGEQSMDLVFSSTITATHGTFAFPDVDLPIGRVFGVAVEYQGALYGSAVTEVETNTLSLDLPIEIYNSTTDPSALVVERLHVILDFSAPGRVQVMEMFAISNPTNLTIAPAEEGEPVASFLLPEGAANLQFTDGVIGDRYLLTPGGFADTQPIYPGDSSYQLSFVFELPYTDAMAFGQELPFDTRAATVLFPDGAVVVESDQLTDGGLFQGTEYRRYDGSGFAAGSRLSLTIRGAPAAAATTGSQAPAQPDTRQNLLIGLASVGIVLILLGVWVYRRGGKPAPQAAGGSRASAPAVEMAPPEDPEVLMDAIIALDDQFRAGAIPEAAYRERRAELKARLNEIMADR